MAVSTTPVVLARPPEGRRRPRLLYIGRQFAFRRATSVGERRIPSICNLFGIGTVGLHQPELFLLFFAGRGKNGERFGIGGPGGIGIGPLARPIGILTVVAGAFPMSRE